MKLTQTLLGFLNRVFDKGPSPFIALNFEYAGSAMKWSIADGVMTTSVTDGVGTAFSVDLSQYTLISLADFIASQPGYNVTYIDGTEKAHMSALVLLDGSGDQNVTGGGRVTGYTSLLYSYMEANAVELALAEQQIPEMLNQTNVNTGAGEWLDFIGSYYGVLRSTIVVSGSKVPEPDNIYGPRIIQEVLRPRSNNKALELAISNATGGLNSTVVDAPLYDTAVPAHDATIAYDGTHTHNSTAKLSYNLFDVEYQFDLEGSEDIASFATRVLATIETFRAAGTHLRSISLQASQLADSVAGSVDTFGTLDVSPVLADSAIAPTETINLSFSISSPFTDTSLGVADSGISEGITYSTTFNGQRKYNGQVPFNSGGTVVESV